MTAVDPEGRIRHPLDVFHSTFNPDGTNVTAGYVPVADGLGQVEYLDPTSLPPPTIALDDLSDVTITSAVAGQRLIYSGTEWINDSGHDRPLMDGAGAVITDGATGEAIVAYGP